jgi:hypothetical protein
MTLKQYIKKLQKIAKDYPNLEVVSASDDEGNDFRVVYHDPTIGHYRNIYHEFVALEQFEDYELDEKQDLNAVIIN